MKSTLEPRRLSSALTGGKAARVGVEAGVHGGLGSVSQENFNQQPLFSVKTMVKLSDESEE